MLSGKDAEVAAAGRAVNCEIPVEREHLQNCFTLRDADESSVGEIHRDILILFHEHAHARDVLIGKRRDEDHSALDHV